MTDPRARCHIRHMLLALLLLPGAAGASVLDSVNSVRLQGCGTQHGGATALHVNPRLNEVAQQLAQGADQARAQQRAGYRSRQLYSFSIAPVEASGEVSGVLAANFCAQVLDPTLRELGAFQRGPQLSLVLASPFTPPPARELPAVSGRVLQLVNAARASARRCGSSEFAAAAPLSADATLAQVALAYAQDMAAHSFLEHVGRDGSTPAQRIAAAGYRWRESGENLASGQTSAEEVVNGWLHSPEHCANLMDPGFRQAGIAFAVDPSSAAGIYWAMEFGTPF
jgi:uncharacterized protein YkwD